MNYAIWLREALQERDAALAEVEQSRSLCNTAIRKGMNDLRKLLAVEAEVERLRVECEAREEEQERIAGILHKEAQRRATAEAEVERLKEDVDHANSVIRGAKKQRNEYQQLYAASAAEVERLNKMIEELGRYAVE